MGPAIPDYPLKTYFERLKMWYRIYDGPDETVGPLVAGRLTGKAQKLALQLRLARPDGVVDVGSDALVRLSVEEVRDPANPAVILQRAIPSGIQALFNKLRETFGTTEQEQASRSLETLFELRRGKMTLQEYAVEFDLRMEEAHDEAGMEMNEVALFYFFFKNSGLPSRLIEDIKLQVHGDLRRYQEARNLALQMSPKNLDGEGYFQENDQPAASSHGRDSWDDSYWAHEPWTSYDDYYDDEFEDAWSTWYGEEEYYDVYDEQEEDWVEDVVTHENEEASENSGHENYQMKGGKKGNALGVGCATCGSKWHHASACPVNTSKGRSDQWQDRPKGKGYGKPKGWFKG